MVNYEKDKMIEQNSPIRFTNRKVTTLMTNKRFLSRLLTALFFLSVKSVIMAQIVSLDEPTTKNPRQGLQGDVQFLLNYTYDDKKVLQSGTKLNLQLNDSLNTYMFYSDIRLSRTDGENDINYGSFGAIYNYKAEDRVISAEGIMQYKYDGAKSLKYRFIVGGGPRWKMINKDGLKLSIVAYTIYFNEYYNTTIETRKSQAKFSTMLSFFTKLSENASIKHNTYYEPDYANPSDYRIESQTTFKCRFNKKFSYKMYLSLNYTSMPPSDVNEFDYSIQNALSFSF